MPRLMVTCERRESWRRLNRLIEAFFGTVFDFLAFAAGGDQAESLRGQVRLADDERVDPLVALLDDPLDCLEVGRVLLVGGHKLLSAVMGFCGLLAALLGEDSILHRVS